jgi:hypothetical protein
MVSTDLFRLVPLVSGLEDDDIQSRSAGLYLLQRNYEEAKRYASRAITRQPYLETAYWAMASVTLDTKD